MQVKTSPKIEKFLISAAGQRFLKFVGMLGSDADGERANASGMANRLLREAELTWGEVLGSGPAPSQGGQQTTIRDLETRLRLAKGQMELAQGMINGLNRQIQKLTTENELQKRAIEGMKKAAGGNEQPAAKIRRLEEEVMRLRQAFGKGAEEPKSGTRSKPNRGGDRAYATDFQRDLNETLDAIESAIDLSEWEQGFVASLRDYKIRISEKQWDHLNRLARQAHVEVKVERP